MTPSTLTNLIADHRQLYAAERQLSAMVAHHPPVTIDLNTGILQEEPSAAIGMTVNARLLRLLGHPDGYGASFPWSKALWRLRAECRRKHPHHRGSDVPYWRGSLCHQAV